MAKPLKIYFLPDDVLKQKSGSIVEFNQSLKDLLDDMLETVIRFEGVGIAANQIGLPIRAFIVNSDACLKPGDDSQHNNMPLKIVNPTIVKRSNDTYQPLEHCMSLPSVSAVVNRNVSIGIEYFDENGDKQVIENATGLLGQCIQHEYDHIEGKLITDYLSPLKRLRSEDKVAKFVKRNTIYKDDEVIDARTVYRNFL